MRAHNLRHGTGGGLFLLAAVLLGFLVGPQLGAQSFDPRDLEFKEVEHAKLPLRWARPKHPKWRNETMDVGNGRTFVDRIIRAESPSARPDMDMLIFGWEVTGSYKPMDYPSKSDAELKNLISKDEVLAQPDHKDQANSAVAKFSPPEGERVDQRAILDGLINYRDRKKIHYGDDLEKLLKLHEKRKYIAEVPLRQQDPNGLIKFYWGACHYEMDRPKFQPRSKPTTTKIGRGNCFKAKTFRVEGLDKRQDQKVVKEYYTFGGVKGHTMAIVITYYGGMQDNSEIQIITKLILDRLEEL